MNPCVLDTHGAMVALATLSLVGCPDWEEHRRQDRRRYAKDTVDSTFVCTRRSVPAARTVLR